jgi:hypothetical protein
MKRKFFLFIGLIALTATGGFFMCGQPDSAFVTIDLGRPGTHYSYSKPGLGEKLLRVFSRRAYAVTNTFPSGHGDLSVEVTAPDLEKIQANIPSDASDFTIEIPAGKDRRITVYSFHSGTYQAGLTPTPYNSYNYGGHQTLDLQAGDEVTIPVTMRPMTKITNVSGTTGITITAIDFSLGTLSYYRSTNPDGPYVKLSGSSDALSVHGTYYYFVSITISSIEGEKSKPFEFHY